MSSKKSVMFLMLLIMVFFASIVSAQIVSPDNLEVSEAPIAAELCPPYRPNLVEGGNRWLITFHNDRSPLHDRWATQGICFRYTGRVGTHMGYIWYSDTYPNWNGRASQEGDQIFMHGDFWRNIGHDSMIWDIVTNSYRNEGAGHWMEWLEDPGFGITIGLGNAKLRRVGSCLCTEDEAKSLDPPKDETTGEMLSPMGPPIE